uniref:F-box domain-containing protein n=1 Tax=Leersia perrieri TaxID=77586 RepID=A0A0D9V2N3_9ORYZ
MEVGFTARRPSPPPPPAGDATACRSSDPTQPPPAKSRKISSYYAAAAIDSLGEDLLRCIFLRLPSLATLVSAALTCRAWRAAVASSSSFRRRFRELHPAPLLGFFCDPDPHDLPVFLPAHGHGRRDRDVLAAIRGGEFLLTGLLDPDSNDGPLRWRIYDCRDGYLLLMNSDAGLLAIVNPLAPRMTEFIDMPVRIDNSNADDAAGQNGSALPIFLGVHLISSEEDPMSFRLVWLRHDESRVQASVWSSDTRNWCVLPWVNIKARSSTPQEGRSKYWLLPGMQADGILFCPFENGKHMLMLDTDTMEFSVHRHPISSKVQQGCSSAVGETQDGIPCIAYVTRVNIGLLIRRLDKKRGVQRWKFLDSINFDEAADQLGIHDRLDVVTIKNGFVYLATEGMILSLCLETKKLDKLLPMSFQFPHLHPYVMAWPPALVGNYGRFAVVQDDLSTI